MSTTVPTSETTTPAPSSANSDAASAIVVTTWGENDLSSDGLPPALAP
jgi:hypothetical protein